MGEFWNGSLKKLFFCLAVWMGVCAVLCGVLQRRQSMEQNLEYWRIYAGIVGNVKVYYPEVREEEIVQILNGQGNAELGRDVLESYGIFSENMYGDGSLGERDLLLFLLCLGVMGGVLYDQLRRSRELRKLCLYMDRISHGDYSLEVNRNREDEFSGLRNEIYKLTVFYKKQAEHALENKRALAAAVADISHQLKTPLTSLAVLADNLLENRDMETQVRQRFVGEIARQLNGMKWLVTTMLKISRLDANVVTLEKKEVSLRELTREAVQNLELSAQWRDVRMENCVAEGLVITGDRKWLGEALTNIVKNAVEHSPQGGVVEITAQENDVYLQMEVRDQGEGIRQEDQKHLFERFYQGARSGPDNAGIGLSLAKEILEKHDGYITVNSSGEERKGSVFCIRFLKCH